MARMSPAHTMAGSFTGVLMKRKQVVILGSTGSVGRQTLEVVEHLSDRFSVLGLAAFRNGADLSEQVRRFQPRHAILVDTAQWAKEQSSICGGPESGTQWECGEDGLLSLAAHPEADIVVVAISGNAGLPATLAAVSAGRRVALANKESLVTGGELILKMAKRSGAQLIPVDSEHNAIFQCLQGQSDRPKQIWLTASGGPFLDWPLDRLMQATPEEALNHPIWNMGDVITIDSATLMNKGLEVIEAHHLFGVPYEKIQVVIHPQSIVHSLVEFSDGSTLAQLGPPDMRVPIQYALTYPDRLPHAAGFTPIDWRQLGRLDFLSPDHERFPGLALAYHAGREGGTMPTVMNAAKEEAVSAFLAGKIAFGKMIPLVERVMDRHQPDHVDSVEPIFAADEWARTEMRNELSRVGDLI